jgi:hypothetical protein
MVLMIPRAPFLLKRSGNVEVKVSCTKELCASVRRLATVVSLQAFTSGLATTVSRYRETPVNGMVCPLLLLCLGCQCQSSIASVRHFWTPNAAHFVSLRLFLAGFRPARSLQYQHRLISTCPTRQAVLPLLMCLLSEELPWVRPSHLQGSDFDLAQTL